MSFRIAPTPSGFLHAGNAFNFVLTALLAHSSGALLRLRIDDADVFRARPEYLHDIFETLHWLGIEWTEGPHDAEDHTAHHSQALRDARYRETIGRLIATGAVFACNCSRREILLASPNGQYPGTCFGKRIPLDTPDTALRLYTPPDAVVRLDDVLLGREVLYPHILAPHPILRRRDGLPAYHVASLADDLDFGITHIVRGEDLLTSTAVQLFISQSLGGTAFDSATFYHHPLLKHGDGEKLSKSAGSTSLRLMRETGDTPAEVYRRFSQWMAWPDMASDFSEALQLFRRHSYDGLRHGSPRVSAE